MNLDINSESAGSDSPRPARDPWYREWLFTWYGPPATVAIVALLVATAVSVVAHLAGASAVDTYALDAALRAFLAVAVLAIIVPYRRTEVA